jgi:hypothetical protein
MARACRDDLPDGQSEIFLQRGLDRDGPQMTDLPVGQINQLFASVMFRNGALGRNLVLDACEKSARLTDSLESCQLIIEAILIELLRRSFDSAVPKISWAHWPIATRRRGRDE